MTNILYSTSRFRVRFSSMVVLLDDEDKRAGSSKETNDQVFVASTSSALYETTNQETSHIPRWKLTTQFLS